MGVAAARGRDYRYTQNKTHHTHTYIHTLHISTIPLIHITYAHAYTHKPPHSPTYGIQPHPPPCLELSCKTCRTEGILTLNTFVTN